MFAPPPWAWSHELHCIVAADGHPITNSLRDPDQLVATGRLIQHAPDLLAACEARVLTADQATDIVKREGFVFDNLADRWQKLAFTFYTMLQENADVSRAAIAKAREEGNPMKINRTVADDLALLFQKRNEEIDNLRAQRDALLAACEVAKERLGDELPPIDLGNHICGTPHADCDMDCMRAQDVDRHNRAVRKIDAAIAKARGDE